MGSSSSASATSDAPSTTARSSSSSRYSVEPDCDPVALHRIPTGPVPLQVLRVARGVVELEPPGDAEQRETAAAGEGPNLDLDLGVVADHLQRPASPHRR